MKALEIIVVNTGEGMLCQAPATFPEARIVCRVEHAAEHREFFPDNVVTPVEGLVDCAILNQAVSSSEAAHVLLVHAGLTSFYRAGEAGAGVSLDGEEIRNLIRTLLGFSQVWEAPLAGVSFTGEWLNGYHQVFPFSTIKAIDPHFMLISRAHFRGFKDFPYIEAAYDYQLRALWHSQFIIRDNFHATGINPEAILSDALQEVWGQKVCREVYIPRTHSRYMSFQTGLSGV